jgi:hypothetical protein
MSPDPCVCMPWLVRRATTLPLAVALVMAACVGASCAKSGQSTSTPTWPSAPPSTGSVACGAIGTATAVGQAIVNGTACSLANSPVVLLNLRASDGLSAGACSGTVIDTRAVLTAAHCLAGDITEVLVYFGSGDQIPSASFQIHPRYRQNDSSSPDVGVVLTSQDLGRPPVPLLVNRDAQVGEQAVIAGWGKDENDVTRVLRAGMTSITRVGLTFLETQYNRSASNICAGDSGGPLLVQQDGVWAAAGVISAASGVICTSGTFYYANVRNPDIKSFVLGLVPNASLR